MRTSKIKVDDLRVALDEACGNITHAAEILQISKVHAMRLTARHDLQAYACKLRKCFGNAATGRPYRMTRPQSQQPAE